MRWAADRTGQCISVTSDWLVFTGHTMQTASGEGWLESIHPDDRNYLTRFLQQAHAAQAAYETRYRLKKASGCHTWVRDSGSPRFGSNGAFEGYVGKVEFIADDGTSTIHAYGSVGRDSKMVCIADRLLEARRLAAELGDADMLIVLDAALMATAHKLGQSQLPEA